MTASTAHRCADVTDEPVYDSDDLSVVLCRPCLIGLVNMATRAKAVGVDRPMLEAAYQAAGGDSLFTDVTTTCVHGTPLDAPWCIGCRLMGQMG
jgi:hypothetical protein